MMNSTSDLVNQGIAALKVGNIDKAREFLTQAIELDNNNEQAWLWLSGTSVSDDHKRRCLQEVLRINPNHIAAKRGLDTLSSPIAKPSTDVVLAKPTVLEDSSISIIPAEKLTPKIPDNLIELCITAFDAGNYSETIQYCNRILEINPSYIDAWIMKAVSTFWLTTAIHNRYDEALEYLRKASDIDSSDEKITKAHRTITENQALWYNKLGNDGVKLAMKIHNIYDTGGIIANLQAREESQAEFIKAMNFYTAAASYAPDSLVILKNLEYYARFCSWINWSDVVYKHIQTLTLLEAREKARKRISELNNEKRRTEKELAKVKGEKGFLTGGKIKRLEKRIEKIDTELQELQKAANYTVGS